jgi:hypothetical protein
MMIEVDGDRIKCKLCGSEVRTPKYHLHVMALHRD